MNVAMCGASPFYSQIPSAIKQDQCTQEELPQVSYQKIPLPLSGSHSAINLADGHVAKNANISSGLLNIRGGAAVSNISIQGSGTLRVDGDHRDFPLTYSIDNNPATCFGGIISNHHGTAKNITIDEKGTLLVACGGKVNGALLKNGQVIIQQGGELSDLVVDNGTVEMRTPYQRLAGTNNNEIAKANNTTIHGGLFTLKDNGRAYNSKISGGELRIIKNQNTVESSLVGTGGKLTVQSGQSEFSRIDGGLLEVSAGASAKNTFVSNGGKVVVSGKESMANSNYVSVGKMEVRDGGTAQSNIIGGDFHHTGEIYVLNNGSVEDTTVYTNGRLNVSGSASATMTKVKNGGYMSVTANDGSLLKRWFPEYPVVNKTSVFAGGVVDVDNQGIIAETIVHDGGVLRLRNTYSAGQAVNTKVEQGGCLVIEEGASALNTTMAGRVYPKIEGESPKNSYECIG